jgi:dsRNA-specific ribonuclease
LKKATRRATSKRRCKPRRKKRSPTRRSPKKAPPTLGSYTCAVYFEGSELGRGSGSSKQVAEVEAAKEALKHLSLGLDQEIYTSAEMAETAIEGYDEDFGTKRKH